MTTEHYVEHKSLSVAWGRALRLVSARGRDEVVPLIVSITGFDGNGIVGEDSGIRHALDALLKQERCQSVETVASTIFPASMWNRSLARGELFGRYQKVFKRIQAASAKNRHGIYFERMITGGPEAHPNQLDFVLSEFLSRKGVRRSMFQIGIFDPARDHTRSALRGFPCLQHVTFAPVDGELSVNAFYATQYMGERAYGNYLGLCRLGQFAAHEMKLKLARVTCYAGIAECDLDKGKLKPVLAAINRINPPEGS